MVVDVGPNLNTSVLFHAERSRVRGNFRRVNISVLVFRGARYKIILKLVGAQNNALTHASRDISRLIRERARLEESKTAAGSECCSSKTIEGERERGREKRGSPERFNTLMPFQGTGACPGNMSLNVVAMRLAPRIYVVIFLRYSVVYISSPNPRPVNRV